MPGISSPQSQAGITSFYDAPSKGPLFSPKLVLIVIAVFAIVVIVIQHFANA